jgi:succinate dehydrogenase/fumarate reductase flavoprotein subunit
MATSFPAYQVVVVGGGLAGFSAAATALELGANVVIIDKMGVCGGNSAKATTGINGVDTPAQRDLAVCDCGDKFFRDTMLNTHGTCGILSDDSFAATVSKEAHDAFMWLCQSFNLKLDVVTRVGGHSIN